MRQLRIVIIGAGIVGLSTAYALLTQHYQHVIVLEQEAVDHRRSTSHGYSRLLRFEYGADHLYSEMVQLSLERWKYLEQFTEQTLYTPTGLLVLGTEEDNFTRSSYHTLRELDVPTEKISRQHCQQYFPHFAADSFDLFTYNPQAGILHASACLQTLKECVLSLGGEIYESCRATNISNEGQIRISCHTGEIVTADRVVLATGPWVHRLLADIHLPVQLTRQYLLYFAGLPSSSYGAHTFPAFFTEDLYGIPMHRANGGHWLKAASHNFGAPIDPDEVPPPEERVIARTARRLRQLLPDLQQAELTHVDACMYDVTPDEDFILDYHPHDPRIVFATGLSGHGFKFGLLLGELMSSLVCHTPPPVPMERFQLARFSAYQQGSFVA